MTKVSQTFRSGWCCKHYYGIFSTCTTLTCLLLLQELVYNETVCSLKSYTTCFEEQNMVDDEEDRGRLIQCEKSCLDICERTTYFSPPDSASYYYSFALDEFYKQANYSLIKLTIAGFDYPIFEETLKWTFPAFFGTIGGALGIWLGINVLDAIVFTTTAARSLVRAHRRRTVKQKRNARSVLNLAKSVTFNWRGTQRGSGDPSRIFSFMAHPLVGVSSVFDERIRFLEGDEAWLRKFSGVSPHKSSGAPLQVQPQGPRLLRHDSAPATRLVPHLWCFYSRNFSLG